MNTASLIYVISQRPKIPINSVLVVGCGAFREAGALAMMFGLETIGTDIGDEFAFDNYGSAPARLMIMDARELQFPDGTFALVYFFHALDHIPGPEKGPQRNGSCLTTRGHVSDWHAQ
jgi:SAM-dependent methyltransferase